jgi:ABC-type sugar transport system ATPase subunit/ribose/xylose/arabinose/galactoside ABC-type transport system permease subunit
MSVNPVAQLTGIRKSFPGVTALAGVDLELTAGSIHALVGENGAGKSTLINILSGVLRPDTGEIRLQGQTVRLGDARSARRHGIVTVHQEVDLFPDLSIAENIGLEQGLPLNGLGLVRWKALRERTRRALRAIGEDLPPQLPAGALPPGQRQLVEIAAAVSEAARVLILDEPTSSLSAAEAETLFANLRRFQAQGTAILYVSHRLEEIFRLANLVTVLRDSNVVWTGAVSSTSPQKLIGRMVGRGARDEGRGARDEGRGKNRPPPLPLDPRPSTLLECTALTAVDESFRDISLEVRGGEILGLYGLIGAGRSEWAQAVFGLRPIARGELLLHGQAICPRGPGAMVAAGLAYVPEDRLRQGLCRGLSITANVVLAGLRQISHGPWIFRKEERRRALAAVQQMGIRTSSIEQPAGTLSGGNQQKVVLGRWLDRNPRVLILDEPTRGVDVGARAELYALIHRLAAQGRGIVLISSELPEILAHSDRVGVFRAGRLAAQFNPRSASAEEIAAAALPESGNPARQKAKGKRQKEPHPFAFCLFPFAFRQVALVLVLVVLFGVLEWETGRFLTWDLLLNLASDTALLAFCAVGAALVILAGGIDISLGALMALSAAVAGRLWEQGQPLPVVMGVAVGVGALGGAANALLALAGHVHPIVVTLATMSLFRGLTLACLRGEIQIAGTARSWLLVHVAGVPLLAWLGLGLIVLCGLFLSASVPGRMIYAVGSNPAAAQRVGIHRGRVWMLAFTLQGGLVGLAGLLALARSGNLQAISFEDKTLEAITAAVVGGVAITGGRGSLIGVALGCLLLVSLRPACVFLEVSPYWRLTLVGAVMVLAVTVDALWRTRL